MRPRPPIAPRRARRRVRPRPLRPTRRRCASEGLTQKLTFQIVNALGDERSVQRDAFGHVRRLSVDETDLLRSAQAQEARTADISERRAAAGGRPPAMRRPDDIEMNARS